MAIHDELDIAFGTLRIKLGGGDNGHNGLRSMRSSLGTGDFYRVRCGIGRPPGRQDVADFVLSDYSAAERKELPFQVDRRGRRGRVAAHRGPGEDPAALQLLTPGDSSSPGRPRRHSAGEDDSEAARAPGATTLGEGAGLGRTTLRPPGR